MEAKIIVPQATLFSILDFFERRKGSQASPPFLHIIKTVNTADGVGEHIAYPHRKQPSSGLATGKLYRLNDSIVKKIVQRGHVYFTAICVLCRDISPVQRVLLRSGLWHAAVHDQILIPQPTPSLRTAGRKARNRNTQRHALPASIALRPIEKPPGTPETMVHQLAVRCRIGAACKESLQCRRSPGEIRAWLIERQ